MPHRDIQTVAAKLAEFMTSDPACQQAAKSLSRGVEIGVSINGKLDCAFFHQGGEAKFEIRPAKNPDVIFGLTPAAVDILANHKSLSLGDLGVEVLKQYVAGEIKIRVPGSFIGIMKNGYLNIIKEAGAPFLKYLATHGVSSLSKIPEIIKKLREKP